MHLWRWGAVGESYIFDCNILPPPNCLEDLRSPDISNTKWLEDLVDFVWTATHTQEENVIIIFILSTMADRRMRWRYWLDYQLLQHNVAKI